MTTTGRPPRVLRLDLSLVAIGIRERVGPRPHEMEVARQAANLIRELVDPYNGLTARYVAGIPKEVWDAAHALVEGGMDSPELRAAAENIDEDAFPRLASRMTSVDPKPDPAIVEEFI